MAKVNITENKETGMLEVCYKCECGADIKLITPVRPKKLVKCFECQTAVAEIDEPVEEYLAKLKSKRRKK